MKQYHSLGRFSLSVLLLAIAGSLMMAQDRGSHDPRQAERGNNFEKNRFVVP